MKIFEIRWSNGEKEWIAAESNLHAVRIYYSITGFNSFDFEEGDEIVELPKDKWATYTVKTEDEDEPMTFEKWMSENKYPDIIAGTMYDI
jgi:hypothetical protein